MNGYKMFAEDYKKQLPGASAAEAEYIRREVKVFEIAADLTQDEAAALFDTSIFNDIFRGYVRYAVDHMSGLTDDQRRDLPGGIIHALDEIGAAEAKKHAYDD